MRPFETEPPGRLRVHRPGRCHSGDAFELTASFEGVVKNPSDADFLPQEPDGCGEHGFIPDTHVGLQRYLEVAGQVPGSAVQTPDTVRRISSPGSRVLFAGRHHLLGPDCLPDPIGLNLFDQGFVRVEIHVHPGPGQGRRSAPGNRVPVTVKRVPDPGFEQAAVSLIVPGTEVELQHQVIPRPRRLIVEPSAFFAAAPYIQGQTITCGWNRTGTDRCARAFRSFLCRHELCGGHALRGFPKDSRAGACA